MINTTNQVIDYEETLTFFLCSLTDQEIMDASPIAIYNGWVGYYNICRVPSEKVGSYLRLIHKFQTDQKTREALRCMQYYN